MYVLVRTFLFLKCEVKAYTHYVVCTRVEVVDAVSISNCTILVEGMHITEVNGQEFARIDAKTSTNGVAAQVEIGIAHVGVRQTIAGVLP